MKQLAQNFQFDRNFSGLNITRNLSSADSAQFCWPCFLAQYCSVFCIVDGKTMLNGNLSLCECLHFVKMELKCWIKKIFKSSVAI